MEARWGPTPHFLPRKAEAPSPQNTQGPPRGAGERQGCAGRREPDLGGSQDEICSPSQLERALEGRGLLDKGPPNIMLYRGPSLWRLLVSGGGAREREAFLSLSGSRGECCSRGWLVSRQASPARISSKSQMCSQQLAVATPSRELPSWRCRGLLACSCRLTG